MPADRRQFNNLLAAMKTGDCPSLILADWLEEFSAEHALWCLAWRDVPEPAEEFQARWAGWLEGLEPQVKTPNPLHTVHLSDGKAYGYHPPRWLALRAYRIKAASLGPSGNAWEVESAGNLEDWPSHVTEGLARRERKRQVLRLFPEVEYPIHFSIGERELKDWPHSEESRRVVQRAIDALGFRPDLPYHSEHDRRHNCYRFWQTVYAPDLIPPEPAPVNFGQWGRTNSTLADDIRATRERMERQLFESVGVPRRFIHPEEGY